MAAGRVTATAVALLAALQTSSDTDVNGGAQSFTAVQEYTAEGHASAGPTGSSPAGPASRPTNLERAQSLDCTPDTTSLALRMLIGGTGGLLDPCRPPGACTTNNNSDRPETTTRLEVGAGGAIPSTGCPPTTQEAAAATVTPSLVQTAFREVRIPHTTLTIEPPGGTTLVNLDTNFHTNAKPFHRHLTLLGRNVELHITPTTYTWNFGDGTTRTTTHPGTPYPDLTNTHRYHHTGTHTTTLTTTWSARYRVDNGPWTPVTTTVDTTSTPVDLRVRQATPIRTD